MKYKQEAFWKQFWESVLTPLSKQLDGIEVLNALEQASSIVYDLGIDDVQKDAWLNNPEVDPVSIDLAWMTIFAVEMKKMIKTK